MPARAYRRGVEAQEARRATAAATAIATSLGLDVDEATVLFNSNKLTLRLQPADVVARVAPAAEQIAAFEVELAPRLTAAGCPVAALHPRIAPGVHERDGFVITLWTYHATAAAAVPPIAYADALERLHVGMRTIDVAAPHFSERVDEARRLLADREATPALPDDDRALLRDAVETLSRTIESADAVQLLHGEPHPGNLLNTGDGVLFVDLETCCRGPVEFDLAHAPEEVAAHYPGVDDDLLRDCRLLVLAMITTWRWDRGDQFPDGRRLAGVWLHELRAGLESHRGRDGWRRPRRGARRA